MFTPSHADLATESTLDLEIDLPAAIPSPNVANPGHSLNSIFSILSTHTKSTYPPHSPPSAHRPIFAILTHSASRDAVFATVALAWNPKHIYSRKRAS